MQVQTAMRYQFTPASKTKRNKGVGKSEPCRSWGDAVTLQNSLAFLQKTTQRGLIRAGRVLHSEPETGEKWKPTSDETSIAAFSVVAESRNNPNGHQLRNKQMS